VGNPYLINHFCKIQLGHKSKTLKWYEFYPKSTIGQPTLVQAHSFGHKRVYAKVTFNHLLSFWSINLTTYNHFSFSKYFRILN